MSSVNGASCARTAYVAGELLQADYLVAEPVSLCCKLLICAAALSE